MKISKNWLQDHIHINYSDEELADRLSLTGTPVESIAKGLDDKVVVAQILKIDKHPDADRLQIAEVTDGSETISVVCGAPNIQVGQKVPLAKVGAKLPNFEIKKSKIRGIESCGMLCARDELALGADHSGIMILSDDYEVGKPLNLYLGNDTIFDIEVTPNRGDLLSHIGVAREIGAFSEGQTVKKEPIPLNMIGEKAVEKINVEVREPSLCHEYLARVITGVKIKPSPAWLAEKLEAIGAKPINNVVDITNYILYDLGQPLHAFDYKKVAGKSIIVRKAVENEKMKALDGVEKCLDKNMLVIADKDKAIAIAGVIGGANSEIDINTTDIVLEAAVFDRKSVRRTSKTLQITTEASYRFERGIDPGGVEYALNKAAKLIAEISDGKVLNGIVSAGERPKNSEIKIEYQKINNLLGLNLAESEINRILKKIGFTINGGVALIPLWRHDISIWQDLAEEVGRIYGYNNIKPIPVEKSASPKRSDYYKKEFIKDILVDDGFVETSNYPFLSDKDVEAAKLSTKDLLEIANPMQAENKYLRSSLIPGLLKNVAKNPIFDPILMFEVGHIFSKSSESVSLGIVASGKDARKRLDEAFVKLAAALKIKPDFFKINELQRDELQRFKIKKPVTFINEVNLSELLPKIKLSDQELKLSISNKKTIYRPVSKYPAVVRDIAFIVDKDIKADEIKAEIYNTSKNVNRVELFDEFSSDKLGKGKKNIAFHLYLESLEKTLTDVEASAIIKKIISNIESKYNAQLRAA